MQDESTPPIPVKDVPTGVTQPAVTPIQTVNDPVIPPPEVPVAAPAVSDVKEEPTPVKEQAPLAPQHAASLSAVPVVIAVFVFIALAVCAYFVFRGM